MRIINMPIESIPLRYSTDWHKWFIREFNKHKDISYVTIMPTPLTKKIHRGSFLDVAGTNYYKAAQISRISEMFFRDEIKDGDVFFFHDIWHPGLEALAYMRDGLGIDVKICGCIFAGSYDPYDFLTKSGMSYWGKLLEESWFRIVDKLFCATEFHSKLILKYRDCDPKKIIVTGHPIYSNIGLSVPKENIVVFPHRLDSEKNPQMFDLLKKEMQVLFPEWKFIKSKEITNTKQEYYDLLQKAKISVSFADQETFGFAMIESVFADCLPLVPNKLSYYELYDECFKYNSWKECIDILIDFINNPNDYEDKRIQNKQKLQNIGEIAIDKMIKEMKKL